MEKKGRRRERKREKKNFLQASPVSKELNELFILSSQEWLLLLLPLIILTLVKLFFLSLFLCVLSWRNEHVVPIRSNLLTFYLNYLREKKKVATFILFSYFFFLKERKYLKFLFFCRWHRRSLVCMKTFK